jgi:hypothetical protein
LLLPVFNIYTEQVISGKKRERNKTQVESFYDKEWTHIAGKSCPKEARSSAVLWLGMHSPVSTASASFVFQCLAIFSARGSSGFGALNRAWMLSKEHNLT